MAKRRSSFFRPETKYMSMKVLASGGSHKSMVCKGDTPVLNPTGNSYHAIKSSILGKRCLERRDGYGENSDFTHVFPREDLKKPRWLKKGSTTPGDSPSSGAMASERFIAIHSSNGTGTGGHGASDLRRQKDDFGNGGHGWLPLKRTSKTLRYLEKATKSIAAAAANSEHASRITDGFPRKEAIDPKPNILPTNSAPGSPPKEEEQTSKDSRSLASSTEAPQKDQIHKFPIKFSSVVKKARSCSRRRRNSTVKPWRPEDTLNITSLRKPTANSKSAAKTDPTMNNLYAPEAIIFQQENPSLGQPCDASAQPGRQRKIIDERDCKPFQSHEQVSPASTWIFRLETRHETAEDKRGFVNDNASSEEKRCQMVKGDGGTMNSDAEYGEFTAAETVGSKLEHKLYDGRMLLEGFQGRNADIQQDRTEEQSINSRALTPWPWPEKTENSYITDMIGRSSGEHVRVHQRLGGMMEMASVRESKASVTQTHEFHLQKIHGRAIERVENSKERWLPEAADIDSQKPRPAAGLMIRSDAGKIDLFGIAEEPVAAMAKRMQKSPDNFLHRLKHEACELLRNCEKRGEFLLLRDTIRKRKDLSEHSLLQATMTQLQILVALKTGLQDYVNDEVVKPLDLACKAILTEIFLEKRCPNIRCMQLLPAVYRCECRICSRKSGFCRECMCVICAKFDSVSEDGRCRWVGCDACDHWCHADCALRTFRIAPAVRTSRSRHGEGGVDVSADGGRGLQYKCASCDRGCNLFEFVKGVFHGWGGEEGQLKGRWDAAAELSKELDCVRKIFYESEEGREKELCELAGEMLQRLEEGKEEDHPLRLWHCLVTFFHGQKQSYHL